jgi:small subunit ribosomal protein S16
MLKLRLARIGKKKQPFYRLTLSENTKDTYGPSLEILGSYNPRSKETQFNSERIQYWLGVGAQMTPTVNNLLIEKGAIKGAKVVSKKAKVKKKK